MAKPNGNTKRQSEIMNEWLELCAIEDKKQALAEELFSLRGNKEFQRAGTTYRAIKRERVEKDGEGNPVLVDGKPVVKSTSYEIRRLSQAGDEL